MPAAAAAHQEEVAMAEAPPGLAVLLLFHGEVNLAVTMRSWVSLVPTGIFWEGEGPLGTLEKIPDLDFTSMRVLGARHIWAGA